MPPPDAVADSSRGPDPVLARYTIQQLLDEIARRGHIGHQMPQCPCHKWSTYLGSYDKDGYTWRCHGCLRAISKCRC